MNATIETPLRFLEEIGRLQLPGHLDHRLQLLMNQNNEGYLDPYGKKEMTELITMSEQMSILRAEATYLLIEGHVESIKTFEQSAIEGA